MATASQSAKHIRAASKTFSGIAAVLMLEIKPAIAAPLLASFGGGTAVGNCGGCGDIICRYSKIRAARNAVISAAL